jgi:hypothetical protein
MRLTAAGVGVKKAILYSNEAHLPAGGSWALCGGTLLFLVGVILVYAVSTRAPNGSVLGGRISAAGAILMLAVVGPTVPPLLLVLLLLLMLLSLVGFEVTQAAFRA